MRKTFSRANEAKQAFENKIIHRSEKTSVQKLAARERRTSVGLACFVGAMTAVAFAALFTRIDFKNAYSDDYVVEHVQDRIAAKLMQENDSSLLVDTGYRMRTRTLVVDADKVGEYDTIEDVYSGSDEDKISKFLYQSESSSTIYDFGSDEEYVAYIDIAGDNNKVEHPQDAVFAYDNTYGQAIENARYDRETGLAFIPKSFFRRPNNTPQSDEQSELQVQTLVRYDASLPEQAYEQDKTADAIGNESVSGEISKSNVIPVDLTTDSGHVRKMSQVPLVGNQFAIALSDNEDAKNATTSDVKVSINDGAIELDGSNDAYEEGSNAPSLSYNNDNGTLNIYNVSPMTVMNIEIDVNAFIIPSMASRASVAYAGEILNPTDKAYTIGSYGVANCWGGYGDRNGARTKTIRRFANGTNTWDFFAIDKNAMSDNTCAYVISIGNCPSSLGTSWNVSPNKLWQADCIHALYPSGENPPSGGYYKVINADWNNQIITVAFFITCDQPSQQEGGIVLNFYAPRNGFFELYKKANANPALGSEWHSNVDGATFGVYSSLEGAKNKDNSALVRKITTQNGFVSAGFDNGTYWVRELSAPWPYITSNEIISFTAKPKSKEKGIIYDDTVSSIKITKKIVPSINSFTETDITSDGKKLLHVNTKCTSNTGDVNGNIRGEIRTEIQALKDVKNIVVKNSSSSSLENPVSSDSRFNAATGIISEMNAGDTMIITQKMKKGQGWVNSSKIATICSISAEKTTTNMSLPLYSATLEKTQYGVYSNATCSQNSYIGTVTLNANGVGYYGTHKEEWLFANTTYYVKEIGSVKGYSVSNEIYPVTTKRNAQVSVSAADSFPILSVIKESGAGKDLTSKLPQFSLKGARYGVYRDKNSAELHSESGLCVTHDGRKAIITIDEYGNASEIALGEGTYYVAEIPTKGITRDWKYGNSPNVSSDEPTQEQIESKISSYDYLSPINGDFLLDEEVHVVKLTAGKTTVTVSKENIPVRIQLTKTSTRAESLSDYSQYSLEGSVFGVYAADPNNPNRIPQAAIDAPSGNYDDANFALTLNGEVALLYGNADGTTTASDELPLGHYYIKELRAPKDYKLHGESKWILSDGSTNSDEILHLTPKDFLSSSNHIDGILANNTLTKANEPADVSLRVKKDSSDVNDDLKYVSGNPMSVAGAKFAVYRSYEDAIADNEEQRRIKFNTDDNPTGAKTTLLVSSTDGWTNAAIGLKAQESYWVREIEPPHNGNDVSTSMYILDSEPVEARLEDDATLEMKAYKDNRVKTMSLTIGKHAISYESGNSDDAAGRKLYVGEKDANGIPYNDAYCDSALEGAIFALFETRDDAASARVAKLDGKEDFSDVSVIQDAYNAGAIAVMTTDANGNCGTIDNLAWRNDGYYLRELKAPTSGCYHLNDAVKQVSCYDDMSSNEFTYTNVLANKVERHFSVEEIPIYYYVKIEKTIANAGADPSAYRLDGIHFGLYKSYEQAQSATPENPNNPLYNLYTKEVEHEDGSVTYEATSGLTGPGTFWAKELASESDLPKGLQVLSEPIRVEASVGTTPNYNTTPIVPENSNPHIVANGHLSYKTASDIAQERKEQEQQAKAHQDATGVTEVNGFTEKYLLQADSFTRYMLAKNEEALKSNEDVSNTDETSYRMLVKTDDVNVLRQYDVIASNDDVHLVVFDEISDMEKAKRKLSKVSEFAEEDLAFGAAGNESLIEAEFLATDTVTQQENPISNLADAQNKEFERQKDSKVVALIDTGTPAKMFSSEIPEVIGSVSFVGDGSAKADRNGHASRVASVMYSVNPNVQILALKALNDEGVGSTSSIYAAIRYAIDQDVDIINLSLSAMSSTENEAISSIISEACGKGIIVVGAAGNNGVNAAITVPGNVSDCLVVGASENGKRVAISNYGKAVDVYGESGSTSYAAAKATGYLSLKDDTSDANVDANARWLADEHEDFWLPSDDVDSPSSHLYGEGVDNGVPTDEMFHAAAVFDSSNSNSVTETYGTIHYNADLIPAMRYDGGSNITFYQGDMPYKHSDWNFRINSLQKVTQTSPEQWGVVVGTTNLPVIVREDPYPQADTSVGGFFYNYCKTISCINASDKQTLFWVQFDSQYNSECSWQAVTRGYFYPQLILTYNPNGGSWKNGVTDNSKKQTKNIGQRITVMENKNDSLFSRTGYDFAGWTIDKSEANKAPKDQKYIITPGQAIGGQDWNFTNHTWKGETYSAQFWNERWKENFDEVVKWVTSNMRPNPTTSSTINLYATWTPKKYTIKFDLNEGTSTTPIANKENVEYTSEMPGTVTVPSRTGYIFQGFYSSPTLNQGTQYYTNSGTPTPNKKYDIADNTTLYAQWKPIEYDVEYCPGDGNVSLVEGSTTKVSSIKYNDSSKTLASPSIYHQFGKKAIGWSKTKNSAKADVMSLLNLTTKNGDTVKLYPVWKDNSYSVQYAHGLDAWNSSPDDITEGKGNLYSQSLKYDDYEKDGKQTEALFPEVYYKSDNFSFKYWVGPDGTKYNPSQQVYNLADPPATLTLTGVWYPSFDYGVECTANKIKNSLIDGSVTIQKTLSSDNMSALAQLDLSGIEFGLYSDASCTTKISTANADASGVAVFSGLENKATYYVKELSLPDSLKPFMKGRSEETIGMAVTAGEQTSYEFENETKEITLTLVKKPSDKALETDVMHVLDQMPPTGAKFALYASEQDAANDVNRISFYDERRHLINVATLSQIVADGDRRYSTATLNGLPNQTMWLAELAAPDYGNHEYKLIESPLEINQTTVSNTDGNECAWKFEIDDDVSFETSPTIEKVIDKTSLETLPNSLREDANNMCDGIEYALYLDSASAQSRAQNFICKFTIKDNKATLPSLPYGKYYAIECAIPQEAQEAGIRISDVVTALSISAESTGSSLAKIEDAMTTTKLYLKKIDSETKKPIAGIIFDIYSNETMDEESFLCSTTPTDASGVAISTSNLIANRDYYAKERFESLPAEYSGNGLGDPNDVWFGKVRCELSYSVSMFNDESFIASNESAKSLIIENTKNSQTGSIEIYKASSTNANATGAIFSVYDNEGKLFGTMITSDDDGDGNGKARIDGVPLGDYTVVETTPLPFHSISADQSPAEVFAGSISYDKPVWTVNSEQNPVLNYQGHVKVVKTSSAPDLTDGLKDVYSLAGATYSLYPVIDDVVSAAPIATTITTGNDGTSPVVAIPIGTYRIVETTEPFGFETDEQQRIFDNVIVSADNSSENPVIVSSVDSPKTEPLENIDVEKRATETLSAEDGSAQGSTTLANTRFIIEYAPIQARSYEEALSAEKMRSWCVDTDENGRASFNERNIIKDESDPLFYDENGQAVLPVGTIVAREIIAPTGYSVGNTMDIVYVFNGTTGKFEQLFPASMETYNMAQSEDETSVSNGVDGNNESESFEYLTDERIGGQEIEGAPTIATNNQIHRADISFHKVDAFDNTKIMSNIPFVLTLLDAKGESLERHLIATDANGNFTSRADAFNREEVNLNDSLIPGDVEEGVVSSSFDYDFTPSRPWFSGSCMGVEADNNKGALIYGDYELREYYREDTQNYQCLEPIYFSVRGDEDGSWIEINGVRCEDGNLTDGIGYIENHSVHITGTEFLDTVTESHIMGKDSKTATETIAYADATPGETYVFETYAFDADTKQPIVKTIIDYGDEIEVQAGSSHTIVADGSSSFASMDVNFDDYNVAGKKITLLTKIYHNGYLSDKHNENLDDEAETIYFSEIETQARDKNTDQRIGFSNGNIEIIDKVLYTNLIANKEYTVSGILMDKNTGNALLDATGHEIISEKIFTPTERNGFIELSFTFETQKGIEIDAVVFETLFSNNKIIASHEDIKDESQTVIYPSVSTVARDKQTSKASGDASEDRVSIIDKVNYCGLNQKTKYEMRGILYTLDENNEKHVIEGSETSIEFETSDSTNGFAEMTFDVSTDSVRAKRVLVAERIYFDGKLVAEHDDVAFDKQIVSYPIVSTTALDSESGAHIGCGEKVSKLVDTVHMEGLKPQQRYRIDGVVMMRSNDGSVQTTDISASLDFVAQQTNEDRKLTFTIPDGWSTKDAIVFEYLSIVGSDATENPDDSTEIARHEDINDENQTIHYPKIGTAAWHPETATQVGSNIDNRVIDTVFYENLVVGYEYEIAGMLVNKEDSQIVLGNNGQPIVASTTFVAEQENGSIDVAFDLGDIDSQGKTLVVFEELFVKEKAPSEDHNADEDNNKEHNDTSDKTLIATHCDIDSESQSMFYPSLSTIALDSATQTHVASSVSDSHVIDEVRYSNLVVGLEYTITGTLMDKDTGQALLIDGNKVSSTNTFTAQSTDGSVNVIFDDVPKDILRGKTLIVFEKLSLSSFEMASHCDIEDGEQSVSYPAITTTASDTMTELHEGSITENVYDDGSIRIKDIVEYKALQVGTYSMVGALMDKNTGEQVASSETKFVVAIDDGAVSTSGIVEMEFSIDANKANGHTFVAFEKLFDEGANEIANHEDIEDEKQTVSYPSIATTAKDAKTLEHVGSISELGIIDTIAYEGLLSGHSYVAYGTLMDKDTEETIVDEKGNAVKATSEFVANEGGAGTVDVVFNSNDFNEQTLAGKTFVAFERIEEQGDEQHRSIASHEDINDEAQSVHYPHIRTIAHAADGSNILTPDFDCVVYDTIAYENLIPGIEYSISGEFMNKSKESVLLSAGKAVIASKTFIPSSSSGSVDVEFELDGMNVEICESVAFERISVNDHLVAQHIDLEDEYQTLQAGLVADELIMNDNETPLETITKTITHTISKTGDDLGWRLTIVIGCIVLSFGAIVITRMRQFL